MGADIATGCFLVVVVVVVVVVSSSSSSSSSSSTDHSANFQQLIASLLLFYFHSFSHILRNRHDRRWRTSNSTISTTTIMHLPPPLPSHTLRKKNCYRTEKIRVDFPQKFIHPLIHTNLFLDHVFLYGRMQSLIVNRGSFYCNHIFCYYFFLLYIYI